MPTIKVTLGNFEDHEEIERSNTGHGYPAISLAIRYSPEIAGENFLDDFMQIMRDALLELVESKRQHNDPAHRFDLNAKVSLADLWPALAAA